MSEKIFEELKICNKALELAVNTLNSIDENYSVEQLKKYAREIIENDNRR